MKRKIRKIEAVRAWGLDTEYSGLAYWTKYDKADVMEAAESERQVVRVRIIRERDWKRIAAHLKRHPMKED